MVLRDLASTNGCVVNGRDVPRNGAVKLRVGDAIELGDAQFVLERVEVEEPEEEEEEEEDNDDEDASEDASDSEEKPRKKKALPSRSLWGQAKKARAIVAAIYG